MVVEGEELWGLISSECWNCKVEFSGEKEVKARESQLLTKAALDFNNK